MDREELAKKFLGENTFPKWENQEQVIKDNCYALADWHISELKKARVEVADKLLRYVKYVLPKNNDGYSYNEAFLERVKLFIDANITESTGGVK